MALRAKSVCRTVGCSQLTDARYCTQCVASGVESAALRARQARPSSAERGYGARWQSARLQFLRRNPLCVDPFREHGVKIVSAVCVDHRIPHRGDQALFWSESNWQALCKRCHDRKTAKEDGAFGRS